MKRSSYIVHLLHVLLAFLVISCSTTVKKEDGTKGKGDQVPKTEIEKTDPDTVVPPVVKPKLTNLQTEKLCSTYKNELPLLGSVEKFNVKGVGSYIARIDTGASSVSLHAFDIEEVEVNGENHVRFKTIGSSGKHVELTKKIQKVSMIKTGATEDVQRRYFVSIDLKIDGKLTEVLASLNDRGHMDYKLLIGRNFLLGNYAVDVTKQYMGIARANTKLPNDVEQNEYYCGKYYKERKPYIGRLEKVDVPGLGKNVARVDTGAASTSFHAYDIEEIDLNGVRSVRFKTKDENGNEKVLTREVVNTVLISTGATTSTQRRYKVEMKLKIGSRHFNVPVNLNDREHLNYKVLLGRDVINGVYEVDVSKSFIQGK